MVKFRTLHQEPVANVHRAMAQGARDCGKCRTLRSAARRVAKHRRAGAAKMAISCIRHRGIAAFDDIAAQHRVRCSAVFERSFAGKGIFYEVTLNILSK